MNNTSEKKVNRKSLLLGLLIIIVICIVGFYRSNTVEKDGVYTIATVYNIEKTRGGRHYNFSYIVNDVQYNSYAISTIKTLQDEGKRFFIQFLPNNPERCLMTDIRVPDSITEAPPEGWKELPIIATP